MHMADALISPAVGGAMWAATGGFTLYCASRLKRGMDERRAPLMGVLGAFVFSAQMVNFAIPGTGSSGHLGGGMLLAVLLGPHAAFLTIASVLAVQALFFADGGLLALGCNIINLGLFPCFVAYPLFYRPIAGNNPTAGRILAGAIVGSVAGLGLGALAVVIETTFSGVADLPFGTFILFMLPIHVAIGVVEGIVTAMVVTFVWRARPEILEVAVTNGSRPAPMRTVVASLIVVAVVTGGVLSWFASSRPDGLEWSMGRATGEGELESPQDGVFEAAATLQEKVAFLPDYGFRATAGEAAEEVGTESAVNVGTSVSGLVGAALTLILAGVVAFGLRSRRVGSPSRLR